MSSTRKSTKVSDEAPLQKFEQVETSAPEHEQMADIRSTSVVQRARKDFRAIRPSEVLQLQRTIGNTAVSQMIAKSKRQNLATSAKSYPIQKKAEADPSEASNTRLPKKLQTEIQSKSGVSLDDVRVHYNSARPAQISAMAYAQGTDIFVGPGQESHLADEAWHVVQQKQGRGSSSMQT